MDWYERSRPGDRPLLRAGVVLGLGLGGFFDGIVFHQVLQWHHMLSAHPDPAVATDLRLNVLWDGLFHALTYLLTVVGVGLVWHALGRPAAVPSGRVLFGAIVAGWGLFNLVEGLVNHVLLGIHHAWPAGPGGVLVWDLVFLGWGVAFLLGGYAIARRRPEPARADGTTQGDEPAE